FNMLGPDQDTLPVLAREFAQKVAKVPGIVDLETSDKAANPALSIRLNNDAASDLGVTVQQVGATIRPLLAGDTVSYWLGTDVQKVADEMALPPGYRLQVAGQQQEMQESFQAALAALGLAIIFIYLILASQFASFTQPVAIMASLPFSLIGVFLALLVTGTTLNIFSIIGFIMLMGLVTKNAILLVDFANRARRAGGALQASLLDAGQVRLRPILMTTAAMLGGMLPLALGLGEGGENQAPMGR